MNVATKRSFLGVFVLVFVLLASWKIHVERRPTKAVLDNDHGAPGADFTASRQKTELER